MDDLYDLIIIGGGINGVAIARDAALRGLKVILFEKDDFGSGASSKSSKLVHGGLRYLEHLHFGLVKESLEERALLLKNASNLVHPLSFICPVYPKSGRPLWQVKIGMYLYDWLSGKKNLPAHTNITTEDIHHIFPWMRAAKGGCQFFDAQMQDNRLVIENAMAAKQAGASIYNYVKVVNLLKENGKLCGVEVVCSRPNIYNTPIERQFKGKVVINATGAWSDATVKLDDKASKQLAKPTKGVHLVVPQVSPTHALILSTPQDKRIFFILPYEGYSLVGTTDTPYNGNPDALSASDDDIKYLIDAFNYYFPNKMLSKDSIITTFTGLRPLAISSKKNASSISREYLVNTSSSGLLTVVGGKYTTHRKIAEKVVDMAITQIGSRKAFQASSTAETLLNRSCDNDFSDTALQNMAEAYCLPLSQIKRILHLYGLKHQEIFDIIKTNPQEAKTICSFHPETYAELTYSINHEMARTPDDWYYRRTSIYLTPCKGKECLHNTANHFRAVFNR